MFSYKRSNKLKSNHPKEYFQFKKALTDERMKLTPNPIFDPAVDKRRHRWIYGLPTVGKTQWLRRQPWWEW